ncbi:unnamed protein product [Lampetra planeri]
MPTPGSRCLRGGRALSTRVTLDEETRGLSGLSPGEMMLVGRPGTTCVTSGVDGWGGRCRREEETRSGVTLQEASALRARRGSSAGGRRSDGSRVGERDAEPGARRLVLRCRLVPLVPLARRWDAMSDVSHRVPESPFEGAVPKRCPARLGN